MKIRRSAHRQPMLKYMILQMRMQINEYAENIDLITFLTTLKQNCGLDLTKFTAGHDAVINGMVLSEKEMKAGFE